MTCIDLITIRLRGGRRALSCRYSGCVASCVTAIMLMLVMLFQGSSANAASGDVLFVKGSSVNVRAGPGTDTDIVAKLNAGYEVSEIARKGRWVNVLLSGSTQKKGWVREDLLSRTSLPPANGTARPKRPDAAQLATPHGVAAALKAAPRGRVLAGFKVAVETAGYSCRGGVTRLTEIKTEAAGVYYLVTCKMKLRYSVLVRPDGKMGTRVVSCEGVERLTGVDPCSRGQQ